MLPKPIYEAIPYLCLAIAVYIALQVDDAMAYASGLLFYAAGSVIWVKRSTHRRNARHAKSGRTLRLHSRSRRPHLPELAYELLPFLYIAAGFALIILNKDALSFFFALLFWSAGGLVLMLRTSYRRARR